jgi:hypothetical protein
MWFRSATRGRWSTALPSSNRIILGVADWGLISQRRSRGRSRSSMTRRCKRWAVIRAAGCFFLVWASGLASPWPWRTCWSLWNSRTCLSYEDYVGAAALKRQGKKKWRQRVNKIIQLLRVAMQTDDVVLGGGNAGLLTTLPPRARLGQNAHAFEGGYRLWTTRYSRSTHE